MSFNINHEAFSVVFNTYTNLLTDQKLGLNLKVSELCAQLCFTVSVFVKNCLPLVVMVRCYAKIWFHNGQHPLSGSASIVGGTAGGVPFRSFWSTVPRILGEFPGHNSGNSSP